MNAFGMLGSYFSQGVYAVAGPFQGAVDIIVVQQEDGSFKSSPWYVKCGDFQGVLKRREKIVDISVNGVPADFYMLLNSRGEAYFEKEVEDAVLALPSTSSSSEGIEENRKLEGLGSSTSVASKEVSQVQQKGTADANGSTRGEGSQGQQKGSADACGSTRGDCMDRIRGRSDDLVSTCPSQVREPLSAVDQSSGSSIDQLSGPSIHQASEQQKLKDKEYARKSAAHSRDTSCLNATDLSDSHFDTSEETSELRDPPGCHVEGKPMVINVSGENLILEQLADEERPQLQRVSNVQSDVQTGKDRDGPGLLVQDDDVLNLNPSSSVTGDAVVCTLNTMITEEWFGLQKALSFESGDDSTCTQNDLERSDVKAMDELVWNDFKIVTAEEEIELHDALNTASILGLRLDGDTWKSDTADGKVSEQVDSSVWVSDALVDDATSNIAVAITENSILMQEEKGGNASTDNITLDKDVVCKVEEGPPAEGNKAAEIPTIAVGPPPSRWTMWPLSFRRSRRAEEAPASEAAAATRQALLAATNIAVGSPLTGEILRKNGYYEWAPKPKLRSYVPTSAQIESLKLKDGPNKVTFTFPRVLGRTQVDASIYLWKWNTRIVISDVDGTITKSDVLGQFMPLVGRDWNQSGVTRLFSAIKENGYEVLFLSARAISQAYLTRQFLINLKQDGGLASVMERADEALLPGAYREVGLALHASPARLGSLTFLRSIVQASCFPLAAYAAQFHDRTLVIALGALIWSIATLFVSISSTFLQVALSRALNGVGLAIVVPAIQSIIADSTADLNRGSAFGWLQLTGNLGSVVGGLCAVLLSGEVFFGIAGWRVAFILVAFVSVLVGALVYFFTVDPRNSQLRSSNTGHNRAANLVWSSTKEMLLEAKGVLKIRTFQVIIAQGIAGSFPWAALAFAPMWLEGIGFSHAITSLLMGIFIFGASLGGLFGGYMGDALAKRLPNSGRIILSQVSSGIAVPLAAILLLGLPVYPAIPLLHGMTLFVVGFCISWNAPATNNPIFAEIVPQNSRATVYALDRSFESVLASFAPPIVGLLAQYVYGYVPFPDGKVDQGLATRKNTRALAEAVYTAVGPPMAVCSAVYSLLYWTYPQDRDKALQFKYMDVNQQALELSTKLHEDMFEKSEEVLLEESRQENAHLLFEGHEVKLGLNT